MDTQTATIRPAGKIETKIETKPVDLPPDFAC